MKNILLVAALALATTTASFDIAAACGSTGQGASSIGIRSQDAARNAVGGYPRLVKRDGHFVLSLSYPQFDGQGISVYMTSFEVVRDRNLRRLERVLARETYPNLAVSIARVDATHWRVTGWSRPA